jgi:hypothetical protein
MARPKWSVTRRTLGRWKSDARYVERSSVADFPSFKSWSRVFFVEYLWRSSWSRFLYSKSSPTTRHGGALGERRYSSYSLSTSAVVGGEWSASRPGRTLARGKDPPRYPLYRGLGGPQSQSQYLEVRRKILSPLPGFEARSPDRPARSQTLYWLSCPGPRFL